jgi:hypothetical protein
VLQNQRRLEKLQKWAAVLVVECLLILEEVQRQLVERQERHLLKKNHLEEKLIQNHHLEKEPQLNYKILHN